jgi:hypothetical protein
LFGNIGESSGLLIPLMMLRKASTKAFLRS